MRAERKKRAAGRAGAHGAGARGAIARGGLALLLVLVFTFLALVPSQMVWPVQAAKPTAEQKQTYKERIAQLDQAIDVYQQRIEENNQKKSAAKQSAKDVQAQVDALQGQISAYSEKIDLINDQIAKLNNQINKSEAEIARTEQSMAGTKKKIAAAQNRLGGRMRAVYESGNMSNLEILLESDSFVEFLNRMEMISRISREDNATISRLKKSIAGVQKQEDSLKKAQAGLQAQKQEVQSSKTELQNAQAEVQGKKDTADEQLSELNRYMDSLDLQSAEAKQVIAEARQAQQQFMDALNGRLSVISSYGTGLNPGGMIWPVPDSASYISSGYGPRGGSVHYGIDIADPNAKAGRAVAIVAAAAGTVRIASNICTHNYGKHYNCGCNGGYGNYVVIDHGNGLLSYYGHMARALVTAGQHVNQGQVIGIMGSTGFSTGPHCHFEIRVNNGQSRSMAARNPLNYVRK